MLVMIVSDHGNIEDLSIHAHTFNPVPTIIIHNNLKGINYDMIKSLTDITPFVLQVIGMEEEK
jgi:bisphosphoglycerate-independent phosphoglycerate mutase (AlkP superfamily)